MTAQNFAMLAKRGPVPFKTDHGAGNSSTYTCHMAAIHWAFMDLGDAEGVANRRLSAIMRATCLACLGEHDLHGSLDPTWYGDKFCKDVTAQIGSRDALYAGVQVGDVLITQAPQNPMHTMVVVGKSSLGKFKFVQIRGFNNIGTLGTGSRAMYDDHDRDIDKAKYWNGATFGNSGAALHRIPYNDFSNNASNIRNLYEPI